MRWQRGIIVLAAAAALGLTIGGASAAPVDLSAPSGELGAANARGFLEFWREVEGVGLELGKGSYLPLRYRFSTESDRAGALGAGFYVPMFEARNVLIREDTMLANLPCGKKLYLWRDPTDASKFQTPDREWKGSLAGDDFTLWRDDGWKVSYRQGRLASTISDDKRVTRWSYDAAGGGRVEQDGKPVVTMEPDGSGQAAGFTFAGKSYKAEYGKRPIMEAVGGQSVLKDLAPALSRLTFPDGRAQTFEFGLTDERAPKLTAAKSDQNNTEYTWDVPTHHVVTEKNAFTEWTYKIGFDKKSSAIRTNSRTNNVGQTELIEVDETSGVCAKRTTNGDKIVTHVFKSPGVLYNKVQEITLTRQISGKEVTQRVHKIIYDELGRPIREIDQNGTISEMAYDGNGKRSVEIKKRAPDAQFEALLKDQETLLLNRLNSASSQDVHDIALNDLAIFYVAKSHEREKAEALLSSMTNLEMIYNLKLRLITSCKGDISQRNLLLHKLSEEYPAKKQYTESFLRNNQP